jgi:hypothetical protein
MTKRVQYCTKINHSTNEKLFSLARRDFKYLSELYDIEIIARGSGVNIRHYLNRKYGHGRWRKLKGKAIIEYSDGRVVEAEIHWFEASGIGRVEDKSIRDLERRK